MNRNHINKKIPKVKEVIQEVLYEDLNETIWMQFGSRDSLPWDKKKQSGLWKLSWRLMDIKWH